MSIVSRIKSRAMTERGVKPRLIQEMLEERIVFDAAVEQTPDAPEADFTDYVPADTGGVYGAPAGGAGQLPDVHELAVGDPHALSGDAGVGSVPVLAGHDAGIEHDLSGVVTTEHLDAPSAAPHSPAVDDGLDVIIISDDIQDQQSIIDAAPDDAHVIVLDAEHSGVDYINDQLALLVETTGEQVDHIAFVGHGGPGAFDLGAGEWVDANGVSQNAAEWTELGTYLTHDARIDLYGCNTGWGEPGEHLVGALAQTTGADVWASNDVTGLGGDWDLETRSGDSDEPYLLDAARLGDFDESLYTGGSIQYLGGDTLRFFFDNPDGAGTLTGFSSSLTPVGGGIGSPPDGHIGISDYWDFRVTSAGDIVSATATDLDGPLTVSGQASQYLEYMWTSAPLQPTLYGAYETTTSAVVLEAPPVAPPAPVEEVEPAAAKPPAPEAPAPVPEAVPYAGLYATITSESVIHKAPDVVTHGLYGALDTGAKFNDLVFNEDARDAGRMLTGSSISSEWRGTTPAGQEVQMFNARDVAVLQGIQAEATDAALYTAAVTPSLAPPEAEETSEER